jgi:hypothetical protein
VPALEAAGRAAQQITPPSGRFNAPSTSVEVVRPWREGRRASGAAQEFTVIATEIRCHVGAGRDRWPIVVMIVSKSLPLKFEPPR